MPTSDILAPICPACNGWGDEKGAFHYCPVCNGRGRLIKSEPMMDTMKIDDLVLRPDQISLKSLVIFS